MFTFEKWIKIDEKKRVWRCDIHMEKDFWNREVWLHMLFALLFIGQSPIIYELGPFLLNPAPNQDTFTYLSSSSHLPTR